MIVSKRLSGFVPLAMLGAILLFAHHARAESELEKALRQYNAQSVKGYIQPITDLFGADIHAGWYRSAEIPSGFNFSFNIVVMAAQVGDDQKTYDAVLPAGFVPSGGSRKTATVFGGKGTLFTDANIPALQYKGSDGIVNTSLFPLAVPQVTIGSIVGTQLSVRFITTPNLSGDKFPKTTLFGVGARHSISRYLMDPPLDIAVGVFYSSFTVGDFIDFKGIAAGAQASKRFSILTLYGGLGWEKSTMDLSFTSSDPTSPPLVDITLDGANNFRFTVGAALNLLVFKIFADANFGTITNFSGGIGFGF